MINLFCDVLILHHDHQYIYFKSMRILIYALLVLAAFSFKVNWLNWASKPEKKVSAGTD